MYIICRDNNRKVHKHTKTNFIQNLFTYMYISIYRLPTPAPIIMQSG